VFAAALCASLTLAGCGDAIAHSTLASATGTPTRTVAAEGSGWDSTQDRDAATSGRDTERSGIRTTSKAKAPAAAAGTPTVQPAPASSSKVTAAKRSRPNFVVITTDDQRADDMQWMPFTRELLGGHGVTFTDSLSPHPLCCPARAELITGQYGQNSGVTHNSGPTGGMKALKDPGRTLPVWLQKAGYRTAMTGKYMHGYKAKMGAEPGWTHWNPSIKGMYTYNNTTFYNDGKPEHFRKHVDDVIVDYTNKHIREFSSGKRPFFVWASALAPHVVVRGPGKGYARPAPRHADTFPGLTNPARSTPAFATAVVDGPPVGDPTKLRDMDRQYRMRVQSLQAVDEGVKSIVETLAKVGELDNTYIIFASDNGLHLGEHGLNGKNTIFEEALRVPVLVRTPLAQQVTSPVPVTITDFAPTMVDLAGARATRVMDGSSFAPLLAGQEQEWRDTQLIQTGTDRKSSHDRGWEIRGVRTDRWTYSENAITGLVELYDRYADPAELVNVAKRPAYRPTVTVLAKRLKELRVCSGFTCQESFYLPVPSPAGQ
jgi:N-acetylglucosamine-6-sulfatase